MSFNLTNQYISQSFQSLVQISGSTVLVDGLGNTVYDLDTIKTGSFTGSFVGDGSGLSNVGVGSGLLTTASFNSYTGSNASRFAGTASFASTASFTPNALITASVASNIITFTKGDGSTFPITVNTGSGGGSGTPGGSDTEIQFNSGSAFSGSAAFRFIYASQSLEQGLQTTASGSFSHAEGENTIAIGYVSHAEGGSAQAIGDYSHAEGENTIAIGQASHAEGYQTKTGTQNAYYAQSVVSGSITLSGSYGNVTSSFVADNRLYLYDVPFDNNYTRAIFIISQSYFSGSTNTIVELYDTSVTTTTAYVGDINYGIVNWTGDQTIPGDYSHAEGIETQVIGNASHAEGYQTQAIGDASHAEGSDTQAIGFASHAEGGSTQAIGTGSHTEGNQTTASGDFQHVQGLFNITSSVDGAFIVGNGTSNASRSNLIYAHENVVEITGSLFSIGELDLKNPYSNIQLISTGSYDPLQDGGTSDAIAIQAQSGSVVASAYSMVDTDKASSGLIIGDLDTGEAGGFISDYFYTAPAVVPRIIRYDNSSSIELYFTEACHLETSYTGSDNLVFIAENGDSTNLLELYANGDFYQSNNTSDINNQRFVNIKDITQISNQFGESEFSQSYIGAFSKLTDDGNDIEFFNGMIMNQSSSYLDATHIQGTFDLNNNTGTAIIMNGLNQTYPDGYSTQMQYYNPNEEHTLQIREGGIYSRCIDTGSIGMFMAHYTASITIGNDSIDLITMVLQNDGNVILPYVSASFDFADDAAASGSVPLGGIYHTSGTLKIRLT